MADVHHNAGVLEADDNTDLDSTYEGSLSEASYTSSITSSVLNYKYENGRRYHAFHEGEYILPNDEQEQDRLDLSHHIYRLALDGDLFLAPVKEPKRILDIGTGTGIWAIDAADEFPEAEVIGNDLSPIQPGWTPANCRFEIDDFEQNWQYSRPFDYIHGRELEGAVRDYDRLFNQAFDNLVPGGYFEIATIEASTTSDDGTHEKAPNFKYLCDLVFESSKKFGKSLRVGNTWKDKMINAGFEDVEEHSFKEMQLPQSPWPKDPKLKELGRYHHVNSLECLGPYSYALLTRMEGWSRAEIEVLLASVRKELKDLSIHHRTTIYMVYGRKPQKQ